MDECPHCGEPIEEDATFCRHCGSDEETGWSPDVDYYSVELPEDDDELEPLPPPPPEDLRARLQALAGPTLVAMAWTVFLVYGYSTFEPPLLVLIPAIYLAACTALIPRLPVKTAMG